jgi:hypothetical protein
VYRWRREDAVSSAAVNFANREAKTVGKDRLAKGTVALPTAWFANSIDPCCWQICWTKLLAKEPSFTNSLLCQQHGPKLLAKLARASGGSPALPTAWAKAVGKAGATGGESPALPTALAYVVGKAGNFFPFSFAVF